MSRRGEKITPIRAGGDYRVVVVVPPFQVSTREAYRWVDQEKGWTQPGESKAGQNLEKLVPGAYHRMEILQCLWTRLGKPVPSVSGNSKNISGKRSTFLLDFG